MIVDADGRGRRDRGLTGDGADPRLNRFERKLAALAPERYHLTLFVNGASARSAHAVADVRALCDTDLAGRFHLDVVDVHEHPELVIRHHVLAAPTLVKERPLPARMVVGDLSDRMRVLAALDIRAVERDAERDH